MRTAALDICVFIFMQIGDQNYLQLMVFALKVEGVQIMGHAMETHRAAKNKPEPLASALKKRKSDYNYNY